MSDQVGTDSRQRGFFWGPNTWVRHWAPLIGLDGLGLLNTYDVWCDRRQGSATHGYAFPSRSQEATFYGVSKEGLAVVTSILEASGWLRVTRRKRPVGHGRGGGGATYTVKNLYELCHRDWNLALDDVLAVLTLADRDARVFRRIRHIFRPDFAPIEGADNPWLTLLPQLRQHPLWQKLAAREREHAAGVRSRLDCAGDDDANRRPLPETIGWNPPQNRRSLPETVGQPTEPTVSGGDRKHEDDDAVVVSDLVLHFASLAGRADYRVSERDLAALSALRADGYSDAEIIDGIERAIAFARSRGVEPRLFTYCIPAIRAVPPARMAASPDPPGQPAPATERATTPAAVAPPVAISSPPATMPGPLAEAYETLQQCAAERSLGLDDAVVRDLARLSLDFDAAAVRQGGTGLGWVTDALQRVDSRVEHPARYVRAVLEDWQRRGCDMLCERAAPAGDELPMPSALPLSVDPASPDGEHPPDLWRNALDMLEQVTTQATFNQWLRNTRLVSLRRGNDGSIWTIEVGNRFAQEWISARLSPIIRRALASLVPGAVQIELVLPSAA